MNLAFCDFYDLAQNMQDGGSIIVKQMMTLLERLRQNKRKVIALIAKMIILLPIIFIVITLLLFWLVYHFGILERYFERQEQKQEEEITRIHEYFQGEYEVYRIPSWIERSPVNEKLGIHLYVLQTEEDKQRNIVAGVPYWPYASQKEALRHYKKLSKEERKEYLVISQSLVYVGYMRSDEGKKCMEEAARYFSRG